MIQKTKNMEFNCQSTPLVAGLHMLEASAGTGKTYSIQRIVLRYLMQQQVPVKKILVVTFTKAATAELRERIRNILFEALKIIQSDCITEEWSQYLGLYQYSKNAQILRLKIALSELDQMPVFTIDSFFNKLLKDTAFESGNEFDNEIQIDTRELQQEVLEDLFREQLLHNENGNSEKLLNLLIREEKSGITQLCSSIERYPDDFILHDSLSVEEQDYRKNRQTFTSEAQETSIYSIFMALHRAILLGKEDLQEFFKNKPKELMAQGILKKAEREEALKRLAFYPEEGKFMELLEDLQYFSNMDFKALILSKKARAAGTTIESVLKKKVLQAMKAADDVRSAKQIFRESFYRYSIQFFRDKMEFYKQKRGLIFLKDLPKTLLQKLDSDSESKSSLLSKVKEDYPVAIIDEFQDTSPQQSQIFRQLFHNDKDQHFYVVGDPKQSIYAFRGADVFAYRTIRNLPGIHIQELRTNYRSEPKIIEAVNHLFEDTGELMCGDPVATTVNANENYGDNHDNVLLNHPSPLQLFLPNNDLQKQKVSDVVRSVGEEIVQLLSPENEMRFTQGNRKSRSILPGDIAVLVRSSANALSILSELERRNVPAVCQGNNSILKSQEAQGLYHLLQCIQNPKNESYIKAFLMSPLWRIRFEQFTHSENEDNLEPLTMDVFSKSNENWKKWGLLSALSVLQNAGLNKRILQQEFGERKLTNFLHLIEVLNEQAWKNKLTPEGLITWFGKVLQMPDSSDQEEMNLRMEREGKAVRVVTTHKSKGLEYPIVFCPFHFNAVNQRSKGKPPHVWHTKVDNQESFKLHLTMGETNQQATKEKIADELRLLYVAMTRAKNLCYLYVPKLEKESPLESLFSFKKKDSIELLRSWAEELDSISVRNFDLKDTLYQRPIDESVALQAPKAPSRNYISLTRSKSSFSMLTSGIDNYKDHDAGTEEGNRTIEAESQIGQRSINRLLNSFSKGANTGSLIHDLLEKILLTGYEKEEEILMNTIGEKTNLEFERQRQEIRELLKVLKELKLKNPEGSVCLGSLKPEDCLPEVAFDFRFQGSNQRKIAAVFEDRVEDFADYAKRFTQMKSDPGYMNGIIDLVFKQDGKYYLLDWKTNSLNRYETAQLLDTMKDHNYILQYHIYLLALHLHLTNILGSEYSYEKHFGGVYYLFLRGLDPESQSGVYFDRPSLEIIHKMESEWLLKKVPFHE